MALTIIIACQSRALSAPSVSFGWLVPALAMNRSSGRSIVKAATASGSERSSGFTVTPSASSSALDRRAVAITAQPSAAYCRANSSPRPRFAPVMRTVGIGLVEQARHRRLVGDPADRLGQQRRDGQPADLGALGVGLAGADGIGD